MLMSPVLMVVAWWFSKFITALMSTTVGQQALFASGSIAKRSPGLRSYAPADLAVRQESCWHLLDVRSQSQRD